MVPPSCPRTELVHLPQVEERLRSSGLYVVEKLHLRVLLGTTIAGRREDRRARLGLEQLSVVGPGTWDAAEVAVGQPDARLHVAAVGVDGVHASTQDMAAVQLLLGGPHERVGVLVLEVEVLPV